MSAFLRAASLQNQPDQEQWLALPVEEQAYWLLKLIDHYRDSKSLLAQARENEDYQTGTMLIKPEGFDHHEDQVISAIDQSTRWLLNKGFMRQFPGQTDGIYQITKNGFDLIDLVQREDDSIHSLIGFVEKKGQLDPYEVEPAVVLGLFVSKMERIGKSNTQVTINIGNNHAINLSRVKNVNIQLPSLLSATRLCKSRGWLKTKYLNSNEFENLYLTQEGLSEYESKKEQGGLRKKPAAVSVGHNKSAIPSNVLSSEGEGTAESDFSVDRNHYVIIIHGIRTQAEYQTKLAKELEEVPNIKAITLGYEYLDVIRFLTVGRNGPIDKITTDIRDVKTMDPTPEKISIIAHSFGTYIVSKILERHTDIDFYRIIFCGSIVPSTFRWDRYKGRFETPILNDCGMFDIWPVFAKFATWGYGPSGRFGFKSNRVRDRFHRFKHSDFFTENFFLDYWKPFLESGDIVEGELEREKIPWWTSAVTLVKAPLLVLLFCLVLYRQLSGGDSVEPVSQTELSAEQNNIAIEDTSASDESVVVLSDITTETSKSIGHCVVSVGAKNAADGPQGDNVCDVLRSSVSNVIPVGFSDWSRRFDNDLKKCVFQFQWFAHERNDCSELASKIAHENYVSDNSWIVGSNLLEDASVAGVPVTEEVNRLDNRYELLEPNFVNWDDDYIELRRFDGRDDKSEHVDKLQGLFALQKSLAGSQFKALVVTNSSVWDGPTRRDATCEYVEDLLSSQSDSLIDCRSVFIDSWAQSGVFIIAQEILVQVSR